MEKVILYKAFDGSSFDDENKALLHENNLYKEKCEELSDEVNYLKHKNRYATPPTFETDTKKKLLSTVPETSGIYMLSNPKDSYKKYIGSSTNLKTRYQCFLCDTTPYAGDKINKAREQTKPIEWPYTILEICDASLLAERENYYINLFDSVKNGYNGAPAHRNSEKDKHSVPIVTNQQKLKDSWNSFRGSFDTKYHRKNGKTLLWNISEKEYCLKRKAYQDRFDGKRVVFDFRLKTFDKDLDYVITIDDVIFIPQSLHSLILPRKKYQPSNGLKTGVIYRTTENVYTSHIVDSINQKDFYLGPFDTEDEAYYENLRYRQEQIKTYISTNRDGIDEDICYFLENITIEELEKLIVVDNLNEIERPAVISR